jgi:hypothetical protein
MAEVIATIAHFQQLLAERDVAAAQLQSAGAALRRAAASARSQQAIAVHRKQALKMQLLALQQAALVEEVHT